MKSKHVGSDAREMIKDWEKKEPQIRKGIEKAKEYKSVMSMLLGIGMPKSFINKVRKEILARSTAQRLMALRCEKGLTEASMAKILGWSEKKLRTVENSRNKELDKKDVAEYTRTIKRCYYQQ
jgi:DNA-binding XRE family transcriptional regulator